MQNELVETKDGRNIWISRSVAVTGIIFKKDIFGNIYILANKRGIGCPDFNGLWNLPCGFLDYDETAEQAVSREVIEETGMIIQSSKYKLAKVITDPKSNKQSVVLRYYVHYNETTHLYFKPDMDSLCGEENEVEEIKWILMDDIENYDWAFEHNQVIKETYEEFIMVR